MLTLLILASTNLEIKRKKKRKKVTSRTGEVSSNKELRELNTTGPSKKTVVSNNVSFYVFLH